MAIYHLLYRTSTPGLVPASGNMPEGRLAINTADERIYFKNASGSIVQPQPRAHTHPVSQIIGLGDATALTTQDLNAVITGGPYYQNNDASATAALNYPVLLAGILEVLVAPAGNQQVMQRYTTRSGSGLAPRVFVRNRFTTSLTWYPWVELGVPSVVTNATTTIALGLLQAGVYTRCTAATAITVNVAAGVSGIGDEYHFRQAGAGVITFVPASGVTINPPFDGNLSTAGASATVTLKCVGTNTYDLFGQTGAA